MRKLITILAAAGLALLGVNSLAGAAGTTTAPSAPSQTTSAVIAVLGPKVSVPPGRFARAYAVCPKGFYVTGGGAYSGAITEIISSPMPNLRGWFVDGTNTDRAKRTFQHRATAVCEQGTPSASAAAAGAQASLSRRAQTDFATSHGALRVR